MATFKAVVLRHQERRDGKFPVSIRVTHNRKPCYIPTGLYCSRAQINKKSFEIKDQFILARTGQTIRGFEKRILEIDMSTLMGMNAKDLAQYLNQSTKNIDFLARCRALIEEEPVKERVLLSALANLEEMGVKQMMVTDFNSAFLRRYKEFLDNKQIPIIKKDKVVGYKQLKDSSKESYIYHLSKVFRILVKEYNTEFHKIITHDPFFDFERYKVQATKKRSLDIDTLRKFLSLSSPHEKTQVALDMVKMSFCMCGMNLLDIQYLTKDQYDPETKRITFTRHKTKERSGSKVEYLFEKYKADSKEGRLLHFEGIEPNTEYNSLLRRRIITLCEQKGLGVITPYQFRHTWATIARNNCDISKDDIDLCLAHVGRNPMADVYIRPDWSRIDRANRKVLDFVFGSGEKVR